MNENIVHKEVGQPIGCDSQAQVEFEIHTIEFAKQHQHHGWNGENQKEGIIFLKKTFAFLVVVTVQVPKESVHYEFVRTPSDGFHN